VPPIASPRDGRVSPELSGDLFLPLLPPLQRPWSPRSNPVGRLRRLLSVIAASTLLASVPSSPSGLPASPDPLSKPARDGEEVRERKRRERKTIGPA